MEISQTIRNWCLFVCLFSAKCSIYEFNTNWNHDLLRVVLITYSDGLFIALLVLNAHFSPLNCSVLLFLCSFSELMVAHCMSNCTGPLFINHRWSLVCLFGKGRVKWWSFLWKPKSLTVFVVTLRIGTKLHGRQDSKMLWISRRWGDRSEVVYRLEKS